MSGITQYEVQVQQQGRWSIHAQFGPLQKDLAIEEAKQLENIPSIAGVKVIRDFYDPAEGVSREFVVYKSSGVKMSAGALGDAPAAAGRATADSSWLDAEEDRAAPSRPARRRPQRRAAPAAARRKKRGGTPLALVVIKLLFVALFSISLAAFFTFVTSSLISGKTLFDHRIVGNLESNVLFVVFVTTFLLAASLMAMGTLKRDTLDAPNLAQRPRAAPRRAPRRRPPQKREKKTAPEPERGDAKKVEEQLSQAAQEARARADEETNERLRAEIGQSQQQPPDAASAAAQAGDQTAAATFDSSTDGQRTQKPLSPHAEKQKAFMMQALKTALSNSPSAQKKLDNYNKFGVNLWLAGASEVLAHERDLDTQSRNRILSDSVQVMGFKRSHAGSFADRYEEYLLQDARYMQMFQAGRNAMNTHLAEPDTIGKDLEAALADWNQPKQRERQPRVVTVLFTDIAGSTAMTQQLGDAGAQEVVRVHNRVVREALTQYHGREVKHTGDGIMASFDQASQAVEAAIMMQRGADRHTSANPGLPLRLKIGINAGEPIQEDNDLFGTTVQLSARIVDKAKAEQIFVSEVVRGICSGKPYQFQNRGGFEMKGFSEPVTLYEVIWSQAAAAE